MIEIRNLSYRYRKGGFALRDVSFVAGEGEITAVLGANGAGKSTLVKCVAGIFKPLAGEIIADGKNVGEMRPSEKAKTFAYVPQSIRMEDSTVFDAVLLGRKPYVKLAATAHDLSVAERVLAELSLTDYALKNVSELSGGERQKVAIAAALAQETKVILFDEPTANLDIGNQLEVMELVKRIAANKGITVVINVHDLNLAYRYSDRFVLMDSGTVRATGAIENLDGGAISEVFGIPVTLAECCGIKTVLYGQGGKES